VSFDPMDSTFFPVAIFSLLIFKDSTFLEAKIDFILLEFF